MTAALRLALAAALAVAAVGGLVGVAVVAAGGDGGPSTTSTGPAPVEQLTLVPPGASDVLTRWRGVEVRTADVRRGLARGADPYPVVVDPALARRERVAGRSVAGLQDELAVVAAALGPVAERRDGGAALAAPPRRVGRGLEVPVLVFNTSARERRLRNLDLRLFDEDGRPVTRRARFLEGRPRSVPAHSALFALVAFGAGQVTSEAPPAPGRTQAEVRW